MRRAILAVSLAAMSLPGSASAAPIASLRAPIASLRAPISSFGAPALVGMPTLAVQSAGTGIDARGDRATGWTANVADGSGFTSPAFVNAAPAGRAWPTALDLDAPGVFYASSIGVHVAASGVATAVWEEPASVSNSYASIYASDETPGGSWATSIVTGQPGAFIYGGPQFAENDRGDAAIVFVQYTSGRYELTAIRRPAGVAGWSTPETILVAASLATLNAVAVGPLGDVLVAWTAFSEQCAIRSCHPIAFATHVARGPYGGTAWQDTQLTAQTGAPGAIVVTIDAKNRAGAVFDLDGAESTLAVSHQPAAGLAWSAPIMVAAAPAGEAIVPIGLASDVTGHASLVFADLATSSAPFSLAFGASHGTLYGTRWSPAAPLVAAFAAPASPNVIVANVAYAGSSTGGSVLAWLGTDGSVLAMMQSDAGHPWSPPQAIAGPPLGSCQPYVCAQIAAAAIAPAARNGAPGRAAVSFQEWSSGLYTVIR